MHPQRPYGRPAGSGSGHPALRLRVPGRQHCCSC